MSDYKVKHDGHEPEEQAEIGEDLGMTTIWGISISFFFFCIAISAWLVGIFGKTVNVEDEIKLYDPNNMTLQEYRLNQAAVLDGYQLIDADEARVSIPLSEARGRAIRELTNLQRNPPEPNMRIDGTAIVPFNPCAGAAEENPCNPCALAMEAGNEQQPEAEAHH